MTEAGRRALVVHFDALGDILRATPMLRGLAEAGWTVDFAVFDEYAEAVSTSPFVADRIVLPRRAWKEAVVRRDRPLAATLREAAALVERIRSVEYGLVVQIHRSHLAARLAGLARARRVEGEWEAPDGVRVSRAWAEALRLEAEGSNAVEVYEAAAGVRSSVRRVEFPLPPGETARGRAFVGAIRAKGRPRVIGLQVGAGNASKRWALERFVELGRRLVARGWGVVVHGAAEEIARLVVPAVDGIGPEATTLAGKPLVRAAAVVAAEDAFVSNDTGPMHLAAAVGTPVLGLFGSPSSLARDRPYAPGAATICRDGLASIAVDDALAGLDALLDGGDGPPDYRRW